MQFVPCAIFYIKLYSCCCCFIVFNMADFTKRKNLDTQETLSFYVFLAVFCSCAMINVCKDFSKDWPLYKMIFVMFH